MRVRNNTKTYKKQQDLKIKLGKTCTSPLDFTSLIKFAVCLSTLQTVYDSITHIKGPDVGSAFKFFF